jgi:hypothetical protein
LQFTQFKEENKEKEMVELKKAFPERTYRFES